MLGVCCPGKARLQPLGSPTPPLVPFWKRNSGLAERPPNPRPGPASMYDHRQIRCFKQPCKWASLVLIYR